MSFADDPKIQLAPVLLVRRKKIVRIKNIVRIKAVPPDRVFRRFFMSSDRSC